MRPSKTCVELSKLLFLRGDLLGRIADHDRAENSGHQRLSHFRPIRQARSTSSRNLRNVFIGLRKQTLFSIVRSQPDIQRRKLTSKGRRCCRRQDDTPKRSFSVNDWRKRILGLIHLGRSRHCWRKWMNGQRPKTAMRPRSMRIMAYRLSLAANCCSNGE